MTSHSLKGIAWGILFFLTAIIYGFIPTFLIIRFWVWLNSFPVYTLSLFMLFLWIVAIIISVIYIVAMVRSFIQRKNEEGLGVPKGVKGFGLVSTVIISLTMIIWYLIFHQLAFLSMVPP
ncbi:hypothetical protein LCGC14_0491880 [marine sediment metagenome]|uniref:Uncharacterized protein n=1 Tax=marine sediment metagenome TaxID=412755 RepID=A0A0F9VF32_9ZZZZ|nr:MAG: hypothetical protein Lokiarch_42290 [Candidatus Lokiarchaeum sp. GC14_75]